MRNIGLIIMIIATIAITGCQKSNLADMMNNDSSNIVNSKQSSNTNADAKTIQANQNSMINYYNAAAMYNDSLKIHRSQGSNSSIMSNIAHCDSLYKLNAELFYQMYNTCHKQMTEMMKSGNMMSGDMGSMMSGSGMMSGDMSTMMSSGNMNCTEMMKQCETYKTMMDNLETMHKTGESQTVPVTPPDTSNTQTTPAGDGIDHTSHHK